MSNLWYLASPYAKFAGGGDEGKEAAFKLVSEQAGLLAKAGILTFAPIAHSHPISIYGKMDGGNHDIWLPWDEEFMGFCKGVIVCMLEGWQESKGITWEIDWMKKQQKPIIYMVPGQVPFELRPVVAGVVNEWQ